MWDQLGNEPSPGRNEAESEIKLELKTGLTRKYNISDKSFNEIIYNVLDEPTVKKMFEASLAAWYNFTREEIIKRCHKRLIRLNHNMKIFRIKVRFIGKIKILWNDTVEKLYSPDSVFVEECCQKYQHIFKGKLMPPKPPDYIYNNIKNRV